MIPPEYAEINQTLAQALSLGETRIEIEESVFLPLALLMGIEVEDTDAAYFRGVPVVRVEADAPTLVILSPQGDTVHRWTYTVRT